MLNWLGDPATVRPMLAVTGHAPLDSPALVYEPKYDGIRALAALGPSAAPRLWSRLGNEKTAQFPEVIDALAGWAQHLEHPLLVDGEIVALDEDGEPAGFQHLQGRIHLKSPARTTGRKRAPAQGGGGEASTAGEVAFILFDLLRDGEEDLRALPLHARRARLEARFDGVDDARLRISEQVAGDGRSMHERAQALGWEGLIAKGRESKYRSGRRSPDWVKLKLVRHQTCVIGGWTEPRGSRPFFGALLLGVHDEQGRLHYIGHTGAGFSDAELGRVWKKLQALKTKTCPFATTPRTNERPHWVKPRLVAEVKFTEWTADRKLRHPTYLGLRDDVDPADVRKEPEPGGAEGPPLRAKRPAARGPEGPPLRAKRPAARGPEGPPLRAKRPAALVEADLQVGDRRSASGAQRARLPLTKAAIATLLDQLDAIEDGAGDGVLELPDGQTLAVTNLRKPFWPALKLTKGDLLRHYVRAAAVILPVLADRPLVLKRYPNGVAAKPFYQHRAPAQVPPGVRVQAVKTDAERRPHFVGGDLTTLLYTAQLGSVSQDPWLSRAGTEDLVDHIAIDLDPPDGVPVARVLDVARWVREELETLAAPGFPKTSGAGGLHIYVPMPPGTAYDAGLLFCQIVATIVARKHPRVATIERSIAARGRRIYVDYLQNIQGKTLASAYSARANDFAGVSTPLTWEEVEAGVSPKDFTVRTFGERLASVGDLWAGLRKAKGADLRAVERYSK